MSPKIERRSITIAPRVETRAEGDDSGDKSIVGYASVFNEWTTLYNGKSLVSREIVRPGAFARAIEEQHDTRALINHDPNLVLGRTSSGTVTLKEDESGLHTVIDPPSTQAARDLMTLLARGDVSGMSFAFTVPNGGERITLSEDEEGRILEEREILDVDLYDVSVVTYPAYEQTSVQLRSEFEKRDRDLAQTKERLDCNARGEPVKVEAPKREELRRWLESVGECQPAGGEEIGPVADEQERA